MTISLVNSSVLCQKSDDYFALASLPPRSDPPAFFFVLEIEVSAKWLNYVIIDDIKIISTKALRNISRTSS